MEYKGNDVVYIVGVAIYKAGRLCDELKKIYGISSASITNVLHNCGLLRSTRVYMLKREHLRLIEKRIDESYTVGPMLRRSEYDNINVHRKLGTYKGIRMRLGLPVHGQRTSSNAKTAAKLNKGRCKL
jgi:small subunit ribosomal protein S13